MKTTIPFFIFMILTAVCVGQKVYYVQDKAYNTNASDMNPGTDINLPWATWQKAFNTAKAGDTVYFRGGVWYPTNQIALDPNNNKGNKGTFSKPICFLNYPGETPILDFKNHTQSGTFVGLSFRNCDHIKIRGLTIQNVIQYVDKQWIAGVDFTSSGTISIEGIVSKGHGGTGIWVSTFDTLYLLNCDSYNNIDSTTTSTIPGGRADGFNITSGGTPQDTFKVAYIEGCRAWLNSDDGFDIGTTKQFVISNCWSWANGRLFGDACGFKYEYSHVLTPEKRKIVNTITAFNRNTNESGTMVGGGHVWVNLYDEHYGIFNAVYNNSSFKENMGHSTGLGLWDCALDPALAIVRNNLVFESVSPGNYQAGFKACEYLYPTFVIQDHNTWVQLDKYWQTAPNPYLNVTVDDFVSLDTGQLRRPRKLDRSLPDITFMKLKDGSDLIDAGVDVGSAYYGKAPDIGAFEYDMVPGSTNKYPTVKIITPADGSVLSNYNNSVNADASDPDGTVSKVEFFIDDVNKIGEVENSPFSVVWNNIPLGNHTLRAVATDNLGAKSTSDRIRVTVIPGGIETSDEFILFPNPNDGSFTLYLTSPLKRNCNISVMATDGKTICTDTMAAEERIKQFNLPFLKPGIYLFMLASSDVYFTKMFVKQ